MLIYVSEAEGHVLVAKIRIGYLDALCIIVATSSPEQLP